MAEELYTLEEAKQYLRKNFEKGARCPCCTRMVKLYKYTINSGQALSLIHIYRLTNTLRPKDGYLHVLNEFAEHTNLNPQSLSFHRLKLWGLLEKQPLNEDPAKKSSGYWRMTDLGRNFVENNATVPQNVYMFEDKIIKIGGAPSTITDALGKKFNYEELMNS